MEFGGPAFPTLDGDALLGRPYRELEAKFAARDPSLTRHDAGFISPKFGVAVYAPSAEKEPDDPVEGVTAFAKGYYDRLG